MMDDDEVEFELDGDDVQSIIDWAVDVASTITLMNHEVETDNDQERLEKLDRFEQAVEKIYDAIPDCISDAAHQNAISAIERAEYEEEIVEEFLEEIKDL